MSSIEFPLSFIRQYNGPLDSSAVFSSLSSLNEYVLSDAIAYAGQIVSISGGSDAGIYRISENVDAIIKYATVDDIT